VGVSLGSAYMVKRCTGKLTRSINLHVAFTVLKIHTLNGKLLYFLHLRHCWPQNLSWFDILLYHVILQVKFSLTICTSSVSHFSPVFNLIKPPIKVGRSNFHLTVTFITCIQGYWTYIGEYWHELAVKMHELASAIFTNISSITFLSYSYSIY
jgi:hypothetical protein